MANVYWYGDTGNWSDHANHWSNTSGGAGGADPHGAAPGVDDNALFNANSFTIGAQTVTLDAAGSCKDMIWTGATNTPTFAGAQTLTLYGDLTTIAAMAWTHTGTTYSSDPTDITTNGLTLACILRTTAGANITLLDDFTNTANIVITSGAINTNGQAVSCAIWSQSGATTTTGSSTITCTSFQLTGGVFNAGTSTIKVTGTGLFQANGLTYNNVELNGTAHTISGSNTFATLTLKADTTQTITFTDGTTQTITTPVVTGSSGKVKTLVGTAAAGWRIKKVGGGYVDADYLALSYSYGSPEDTWYAGENSTDTVGNSGWIFSSYANRVMRGGWWMLKAMGRF